MKRRNLRLISIILVSLSGLFLYIQYVTHNEFMFHLAAIPLEVLLALFIVQRFLENRRNQDKRRQLMYIKSYLFRAELRSLFVSNFRALEYPAVTMTQIKNSTLEELNQIRKEAVNPKYKSLEAMEQVVNEYVKSQHIWRDFMDRAITYDFQDVFENMIEILHFTHDVKFFRDSKPGELFVYEARKNSVMMNKVEKILGDGIRSFLDYAIELKTKYPDMFLEMISDYELVWEAYMKGGVSYIPR